MDKILIALSFVAFAGILFINVYFRVKVFKAYKVLVKNRVEFEFSHLFNKEKLETEVLPRYPNQQAEILQFVNGIRFSMQCATLLVAVITFFCGVLMWTR